MIGEERPHCPTGCGRDVGTRPMCGLCWSTVPQSLRKRVSRSWAAYRRAKTTGAINAARGAYDQALDAAIASVP